MNRINALQLRKKIRQEEFDYALLCGALSDYSGIRQKINQLLKAGVIIRVKKGLYVFGHDYSQRPVCKETLANLMYGPSCISLEYALSFHGLIPERVETLTSITPKKDKKFSTPLGNFTYRYLRLELYAAGIEQIWIDDTHPVLMASGEKAICDYIVLKNIPHWSGPQEAKEFLEEDLRITSDHWKKFNLKSLYQFNKIYRSQNINYILDLLVENQP